MIIKSMAIVAFLTIIPVFIALIPGQKADGFFKIAGVVSFTVNFLFWSFFLFMLLFAGAPTCL